MSGYGEEDEKQSEPSNLRKFFTNPVNLIAIFAIFMIIFLRGTLGTVLFDKAVLIGFGLLVGITILRLGGFAFKAYSKKIIWEDGFSTTTGHGERIGNFIAFRLGAISTFGLNIEGNDGTLICPVTSVNPFGKCIASTVYTYKAPVEELPLEIQLNIEQKKMPAPYLFGIASESQALETLEDVDKITGVQKPTLTYIFNHMRDLQRYASLVSDISKHKFKTMEDVISAISRIETRKKRGGRLADIFKRGTSSKDEGE